MKQNYRRGDSSKRPLDLKPRFYVEAKGIEPSPGGFPHGRYPPTNTNRAPYNTTIIALF